jgi:hypothetical protein
MLEFNKLGGYNIKLEKAAGTLLSLAATRLPFYDFKIKSPFGLQN